jgi:hypothetical protein
MRPKLVNSECGHLPVLREGEASMVQRGERTRGGKVVCYKYRDDGLEFRHESGSHATSRTFDPTTSPLTRWFVLFVSCQPDRGRKEKLGKGTSATIANQMD